MQDAARTGSIVSILGPILNQLHVSQGRCSEQKGWDQISRGPNISYSVILSFLPDKATMQAQAEVTNKTASALHSSLFTLVNCCRNRLTLTLRILPSASADFIKHSPDTTWVYSRHSVSVSKEHVTATCQLSNNLTVVHKDDRSSRT